MLCRSFFPIVLCAMALQPVLGQTTESPPQVTAANNGFRTAYAQAKKDILAKSGPVIVAAGDKVYLINNGKREEQNTISPEYTLLKTVDHIPLALFVLLEKRLDASFAGDTQQALNDLIRLTSEMLPSVSTANIPTTTKKRLTTMLERSHTFAGKILADGRVSRSQLDAFIAEIRQPTLDNIYDAVILELSSLDGYVQKWRKGMTPEQWSKVHVVVTGGHMPRDRERRMQYFSVLLGEKREGQRLIFMEGSDDVDRALDLLATHILDESIGQEYFKDKWRMHRDLLSDAAARYLRAHPPNRH